MNGKDKVHVNEIYVKDIKSIGHPAGSIISGKIAALAAKPPATFDDVIKLRAEIRDELHVIRKQSGGLS